MLIQIINGTYGYRVSGYLTPKTRSDPPFDVDDNEAKRLVSLGVAEYVNTVETNDCGEGSSAPATEIPAGGEKLPSATPEYSEANTIKELLAICKEYGIELVGTKPSKKAILAALDLYFSEEAPPDLSAAMPE